MYLLKKDNYEFDKILRSGYEINEQQAIISENDLANGKIKRVYANYETCEITIKFGGLNKDEIANYYNKFVDGSYEYWSIKDKKYKTANFLINKPSIVMEYSYDEQDFDDLEITLKKSG